MPCCSLGLLGRVVVEMERRSLGKVLMRCWHIVVFPAPEGEERSVMKGFRLGRGMRFC